MSYKINNETRKKINSYFSGAKSEKIANSKRAKHAKTNVLKAKNLEIAKKLWA